MTTRLSGLMLVLSLVSVFLLPATSRISKATAADFQLNNPGIELRRLQICTECSEPLVVTSIAPGAAVRCPKCHRVQRRLPDSELIIKVYQICPSCSQRLDVSSLKPMEAFECGSCGFKQRVLPEAVYLPPTKAGTGSIPAQKKINPAANILPEQQRAIPEASVPGLNVSEGEDLNEYEIEIESPAHTPEKEQSNGVEKPAESTENAGAYLNLPEIDNDIEGSVTIMVNGHKIYESAIMRRIISKFEDYQSTSNKTISVQDKARLYTKFRKEAEEELINESLMLQEAEKAGLMLPDKIKDKPVEVDKYLREALSPKYASRIPRPSTGDLMKYYKENTGDYSTPAKYLLEAIVIYNDRSQHRDTRNSRIIAKEIRAKLDKDVDFTLLARRYSEGSFHNDGGRIRGAEEKYISANFLIKPLRRRNSSLQSGDIFGPVELPNCQLFVQVSGVKPGSTKPFNNVRREVQKDITRDSLEQAFNQWLSTIRKAAVIEYRK